jgi:hypothetical protein
MVLAVSALEALAVGSHPGNSTAGIVTAGLGVVALAPLAYAKVQEPG